MPRRKIKPAPEQLVREYQEDSRVGIKDLRERYGLSYEDVYRPLAEAKVLRGTGHLRRHREVPE
jgi:DNA-binding Lrp family transcriptional regulator